MARTPLMQSVEDAVSSVAAEERLERSTRRTFVKTAGAAGLGLAVLGRLTPAARAATPPKIVDRRRRASPGSPVPTG